MGSNAFSRIRVAVSARVLPWLRIPIPLTFVGVQASVAVCRSIAGSGARRVLLVSDKPLLALGIAQPMIDALREEGVQVEIFDEVVPDPDEDLVMRGVQRMTAMQTQALIAIGKNSPIDCAKAMNLCYANGRTPTQLAGLWLYAAPRRRGLPFYAVPTTAGTGSEVTMAAVVSDRKARVKRSIIDPRLVPDAVALDPALTTGLPASITAATGMDALTHAVEAYCSTLATTQTDAWALSAVTLISRHLVTCTRDGANLAAREGMLLASYQAGLAFTRAGVGYVHAIAHQLGALYHVPHGLANAIVMPRVLDFSKARSVPRLAQLARAAGLQGQRDDDAWLADAFVAWVRQLNAELKIPAIVEKLAPQDFGQIVRQAFAEAHGTYGVPRYMDTDDALGVLNALTPQPAH